MYIYLEGICREAAIPVVIKERVFFTNTYAIFVINYLRGIFTVDHFATYLLRGWLSANPSQELLTRQFQVPLQNRV